MNEPLVSIVILNWNSLPYVYDCIASILLQTYSNYEVIFVDNGSTDQSLENCKSKYPNFVFVENKINLGFSGGMNSALDYVHGKYCLLLNTDVYLDSNFLSECIYLLESDKNIVCTAGYELKWIYPREFSENRVGSGAYGIALRCKLVGVSKVSDFVFGVSGSFPVFRTEEIKSIINFRGFFFDELFETGWEDTDIRFLLALRGKKTKLCTRTKAWHIGSAADGGNNGVFEKSLNYQKRIFRNRLYIIEKYVKIFPLWHFYVLFINFFIHCYIFVYHRESLSAWNEAKKDFMRNRENMVRQRKEILKSKYLSKWKLLKFIQAF